MSFASPWMLLLAFIPVGGTLLQLLGRRRAERGGTLPAVLRGFVAGGRVRLGHAIPRLSWRFWIGLLLLVVATARPQWGTKPGESGARHEVMIALDLSRSMMTVDTLPSRIERARTIATRFVEQSPTADIGLIAFAGRAYMLAAPSADRALLLTFLPAVQPDQMVVPGSNLESLLEVARDAFGPKATSRTLLLLSDGEAEPTPWRHLLPQLQAQDIHVVAVGLGTPSGAHITIGGRDLVNASGTAVTSRLNADVLRDVTRATGGTYLDAAQSRDLAARIGAMGRDAAAKRMGSAGGAREDRFGWFLLPALLLLSWSVLVEWPALPRLAGVSPRRDRRAGYALVAMLALLPTIPRGQAVDTPSVTAAQSPAEPDPLLDIKRLVGALAGKRRLDGADYMALARATARYGEVHRQHAHLLQFGVIQDGLAAVDAGQALDPKRPGWAALRVQLIRLLKPPRTADDPEAGDGAPDEGEPPQDEGGDEEEPGYDPNGQPQDSRTVGGTQRSQTEQAEWRVPSLVKPAYTLRKLREADKPGELFRLMQMQNHAAARTGAQTW